MYVLFNEFCTLKKTSICYFSNILKEFMVIIDNLERRKHYMLRNKYILCLNKKNCRKTICYWVKHLTCYKTKLKTCLKSSG